MGKNNPAWLHNSHIGYACMMQKQAVAILNSTTASVVAKRVADTILEKAQILEVALREERIDPK